MLDWDGLGWPVVGDADGDGGRAAGLVVGVAAAACAAWDGTAGRALLVTVARTLWLTVTVGWPGPSARLWSARA